MHRIKKIFTDIFPYDKLLHFMLGTYTAIATKDLIALWQSLLIISMIAVGIEIYDKLSDKGTPELLDIVYTIAGWGVTYLIMMIKSMII